MDAESPQESPQELPQGFPTMVNGLDRLAQEGLAETSRQRQEACAQRAEESTRRLVAVVEGLLAKVEAADKRQDSREDAIADKTAELLAALESCFEKVADIFDGVASIGDVKEFGAQCARVYGAGRELEKFLGNGKQSADAVAQKLVKLAVMLDKLTPAASGVSQASAPAPSAPKPKADAFRERLRRGR